MDGACEVRIAWIDVAKGLGILLVVAGHSRLAELPVLGSWVNSFQMPLFFVLAGLCFDGRTSGRRDVGDENDGWQLLRDICKCALQARFLLHSGRKCETMPPIGEHAMFYGRDGLPRQLDGLPERPVA